MRSSPVVCCLLVMIGGLTGACATTEPDLQPGDGGGGNPDAVEYIDGSPKPDAPPDPIDAYVPPTIDAYVPPTIDAYVPPPPIDAAPPPPDAPPAAACTLVSPQTGCPGQACDLDDTAFATGGKLCRAVTASGTDLNTCTGETGCAAGHTCLGGGPSISSCMEYCDGDSDCTSPGGLCLSLVYGDPQVDIPPPPPSIEPAVCSQNCNPISLTGCPSGMGCRFGKRGTTSYTFCQQANSGGTQWDACSSHYDCASGYLCVNDTFGGSCYRICNLASPSCPATWDCGALSSAPTIGGVQYGACYL